MGGQSIYFGFPLPSHSYILDFLVQNQFPILRRSSKVLYPSSLSLKRFPQRASSVYLRSETILASRFSIEYSTSVKNRPAFFSCYWVFSYALLRSPSVTSCGEQLLTRVASVKSWCLRPVRPTRSLRFI